MNDLRIIVAKGTGSWLREHLSPSGLVRMFGEGLIGDYAEKMDLLREVDENIAAWTVDLEQLIKQARSYVKNKKILDAAIILSQINQKLKQVSLEGKRIQQVQEQALREFEAQHELDLPEEMRTSAGMLDNLKHRWVANKLKSQLTAKKMVVLEALLRTAERVVHSVRAHLKNMGAARDHGNIGKYVEELGKLSGLQSKFESQFNAAYQNYFKELVDAIPRPEGVPPTVDQPQVPATMKEVSPTTEPGEPLPLVSNPNTEMSGEKTVTTPVNFSGVNTVTTPVEFKLPQEESEKTMISPILPPAEQSIKLPVLDKDEEAISPGTRIGVGEVGMAEPIPKTVRTPVMAMWNERFIKELIRLSETEDVGMMVCAAVKYSEQIEDLDPELSAKLLAYAEDLIG